MLSHVLHDSFNQTYKVRWWEWCMSDMSNSIAVPLVLLFLKVLPLPLIIAYVDLEQLVLQLILVSSNNYWLLEHCYWSLGNWKYCYCNWYWNCTEKRIGIGIAIGIVLHKQLVLVLPLILHSKNNWYWYCNWYCIPQTIDIGIAIDIAFKKQLLLPLPLLMLMMSNHAFFIKFTPWYIDRIHRNLDLQYWYWHWYCHIALDFDNCYWYCHWNLEGKKIAIAIAIAVDQKNILPLVLPLILAG